MGFQEAGRAELLHPQAARRRPGAGPLRKIVRHHYGRGTWHEILECGHTQLPVRDLVGETNAERRRCRKCKLGRPADVAPQPGGAQE